jgi:hypothetical protein
MSEELTSVSAVAKSIGWPRKRLHNYLRRREHDLEDKGRPVQLVYGAGGHGSVYRVNRSQLQIHCPELFEAKPPEEAVKVLRDHLTDTARRIDDWQGDLDEFRMDLGAQAESVATVHQELHDRVDRQNLLITSLVQTVRSLEKALRGPKAPMRLDGAHAFAMDEGSKFSLPPTSETTNRSELANHGPTPTEKTYQAPHDNAAWT